MLRIIIVLLCTPLFTIAQVGIGTSTPDAKAQLDVSSTTKGFLPPRMTQAQRMAINPSTAGLMVYQTDGTAGLWYYSGSGWIYIINSTSATLPVANGGTGETTIAGVKSILGLSGANVAIGSDAGTLTQTTNAIAIGSGAGRSSQGLSAIGIGYVAGYESQGSNGIAIGSNTAQANQATQAVAIGYAAGQYSQGTNAVAIGSFAGNNAQVNNSIAINASGASLNPTNAGFYVDPIRNVSGSSTLFYNTTTKEVTYSNVVALSPTYIGINTTLGSIHNGAIIYTEHGAWPVFPENLPDGFKCTIIMHSNHPWTSNTLTTPKFFSKLTGMVGSSNFSMPSGGVAEVTVVTIGGIKSYFVTGDIN